MYLLLLLFLRFYFFKAVLGLQQNGEEGIEISQLPPAPT